MTEHEAWKKISNMMYATICSDDYLNGDSICEAISLIAEIEVSVFIAQRMLEKVNKEAKRRKKSTNEYVWSHTKRGFQARDKFCLKMARRCRGY